MNNILRVGLRACANKFVLPKAILTKSNLTSINTSLSYSRTLWHMCSTSKFPSNFLKRKPVNELCECGCSGLLHTSGEKELVQFLEQEISAEKKAQKMKSLPSELDGFTVLSREAELKFEKKTKLETIEVVMNVSQSVDSEEVRQDGEYVEQMKAKPDFVVNLIRNEKTLGFFCSYVQLEESEETETTDVFQINEVSYFEGKQNDNTYSASADLLDENLYDIFMDILSEKGITGKFMSTVSDIATSHEHSQYIDFLENMRKFASVN